MFCGKCGYQVPEDMLFCPNCGASLKSNTPQQFSYPQNHQPSPIPSTFPTVPNKPFNKKPLIGIICILSIVVALIVLCFSLLKKGSPYDSPEKLVEYYIEAQYDFDIEAEYECYPDFVIDYHVENYGFEDSDELIDYFEEITGSRIGSYPDFKYEINEINVDYIKEGDEDNDFEDYLDECKRYYDLKKSDIKSIEEFAEVEVDLTINYGNDRKDDIDREIICVKIDSKWYLLP